MAPHSALNSHGSIRDNRTDASAPEQQWFRETEQQDTRASAMQDRQTDCVPRVAEAGRPGAAFAWRVFPPSLDACSHGCRALRRRVRRSMFLRLRLGGRGGRRRRRHRPLERGRIRHRRQRSGRQRALRVAGRVVEVGEGHERRRRSGHGRARRAVLRQVLRRLCGVERVQRAAVRRPVAVVAAAGRRHGQRRRRRRDAAAIATALQQQQLQPPPPQLIGRSLPVHERAVRAHGGGTGSRTEGRQATGDHAVPSRACAPQCTRVPLSAVVAATLCSCFRPQLSSKSVRLSAVPVSSHRRYNAKLLLSCCGHRLQTGSNNRWHRPRAVGWRPG